MHTKVEYVSVDEFTVRRSVTPTGAGEIRDWVLYKNVMIWGHVSREIGRKEAYADMWVETPAGAQAARQD